MKKIKVLLLLLTVVTFCNADVNDAVQNFFTSIQSNVNDPAIVQNQSAGVVSLGGIATRSQVVNLTPMTFTPPSFNTSCGNMNFYSGSLTFMTSTDQLVQFLQNTLMTAGITAVMTAMKAATPNIAGTLQSMLDLSQKMLGMFNNSCQLGMALGNSADSWMYDRIAKAKGQAYSNSADASAAEINSTTTGSGGGNSNLAGNMSAVADNYHTWLNKNAQMNPTDITAGTQDMAAKYGSVIWKGMQALHMYSLPVTNVASSDINSIANLVISLTGDLIIYSPINDGTGTATRTIPPTITDVRQFMTSQNADMQVYNCPSFSTTNPGECNATETDLSTMQYPTNVFTGGIIKKIKTAIDDIQTHFTNGTDISSLSADDLTIISIAPMPIFSIAQTLDDIGMAGSISNFLSIYSDQIAFEVLQNLINVSFNLANQAASARSNKDTQQAIQSFTSSIANLQIQVNSYASTYEKADPVEILQKLNYLRGYAQNIMSPQILQKVNFAKQLGND